MKPNSSLPGATSLESSNDARPVITSDARGSQPEFVAGGAVPPFIPPEDNEAPDDDCEIGMEEGDKPPF